uniref:hypothetical protein n=1 Tax=uncultured Sphingomonas sp. TaxID=158754 RepID=UPI0025FC45BB|nr:hypothetical protein [uncultured Sphingomonas sp.]
MTHPTPRRAGPQPSRRDGWTLDRQAHFLAELARTRCVTRAAAAVGMSREGAYRLRRRPSARRFALVWDRILASAPPPPGPGHKGHSAGGEGHASFGPDALLRSGKGHEAHARREPRAAVNPIKPPFPTGPARR